MKNENVLLTTIVVYYEMLTNICIWFDIVLSKKKSTPSLVDSFHSCRALKIYISMVVMYCAEIILKGDNIYL